MIPLDLTRASPPGIVPRAWQVQALSALASTDCDSPLIDAVMGSGKSILIVCLVRAALAGGAQRIAVIAPTEALVEQLSADLVKYVGAQNVGLFYGREKSPARPVMIACFPSIENMVAAVGPGFDLLICDECHLSESRMVKDAVDALQPRYKVGFSATPYRSDEQTLSLWKSVAYSYRIGDALRDGVLVPWTVVHPEDAGDLDDVCIDMIRRHNPEGTGIIGARSIEDAETFAERLCAEGIKALPIHSGLSARDKDRALSALKKGDVRCLVHVDMLTTGVNIPWLSWLMLRRKYSSRTSFLQFFGRGLRASDGKSKVTIFDPWFQLGHFSLEYAAALGENGALDAFKVAKQPEDEEAFDLIDLPEYRPGLKIPKPTAQRAVSAWARAVLHAAQAAGVVDASPWDGDGAWRRKPASAKQSQALQKLSWGKRHLPKGSIFDGFDALLNCPEHLTSGAASDLQSVIMGGIKKGEHARNTRTSWRWVPPVEVPVIPKRVRQSIKEV